MDEIRYVVGDATKPEGDGPKIVAHVCNDIGVWGRGFVLALARRWPMALRSYRQWYYEREEGGFGLGATQMVQVEEDVWVANMIGQRGVRNMSSPLVPVRYVAIGMALETVAERALDLGASVHMPRIGCGLAGGRWELVEPLITERVCRRGVGVTVYDLA